jgi:alcohol dehydrogenase (cytochrome c)
MLRVPIQRTWKIQHGDRTFRLLPRTLTRALWRLRIVTVFIAAGSAAVFIGLACGTPAAAQQQPGAHGPTQAELDNADTDPANWLTDNKGYLGYRFSPLSSINADNAHELKQICTFPLGLKGSFQNGPIVYEGTLYTTTAFTTTAIDAATCEKRWRYDYKPDHPLAANNKGAAIAAGRVIRGAPDGHLIALDAKTGALLWDRQIMDPAKGEFATAAPLVWDDMVFIGKAGADLGIRGEMMAFKAIDGEKIWGFYTIPSPRSDGRRHMEEPDEHRAWRGVAMDHRQPRSRRCPLAAAGRQFWT